MTRNQTAGAASSGVSKVARKIGTATPNKIWQQKGKSAAKPSKDGLWKKTSTLEQILDTIDRKVR